MQIQMGFTGNIFLFISLPMKSFAINLSVNIIILQFEKNVTLGSC